jgi:hypothetical protein
MPNTTSTHIRSATDDSDERYDGIPRSVGFVAFFLLGVLLFVAQTMFVRAGWGACRITTGDLAVNGLGLLANLANTAAIVSFYVLPDWRVTIRKPRTWFAIAVVFVVMMVIYAPVPCAQQIFGR